MPLKPINPLLARGGGAAANGGVYFQHQLGAQIATWILSDNLFDPTLSLGDSRPEWIRFETEAPVDDILVATSNEGFVAIQAKTTVSSSSDVRSPFGKTIEQFVRHWLACRDGDGSLEWNRPLDATKDRLVLAVSPRAPETIRVDLPSALELLRGPGNPTMTQKQQRALGDFKSCISQIWPHLTSEPFDENLIVCLAALVRIYTFDQEKAYPTDHLASLIAEQEDVGLLPHLLSQYCAELMVRRGGADLQELRQALLTRKVRLKRAPRFSKDIAALKKHSAEVNQSLSRYEVIQSGQHAIGITRDCQADVEQAARAGSLVIVGEPGAGKSGVLNALATKFKAEDQDVVVLAVDRYSVETLEGLAAELKLEHGLIETLEAWDGPHPGWLIVDALDATRGGKGEGVFRSLIEAVLKTGSRWRVIASIRTFDLQMGQQLRSLFMGAPPIQELSEKAFSAVRHVKIPQWSVAEFERLSVQAPELRTFLDQTSQRVRDLAAVPFNTRLLAELISDGVVSQALADVESQSGLLNLYWGHRIQANGLPAESCLARIVTSMIHARALRANRIEHASPDPAAMEALVREGVLVLVDGGRWIQFRHHLLFDYSASRLFIDPYEIAVGKSPFGKQQALGLMLSPAMAFALHELWPQDPDRKQFWQAVLTLLGDDTQDTVIRSIASRVASELPSSERDVSILAATAADGLETAITSLSHIIGALAVRLEDGGSFSVAPWASVVETLARKPGAATWSLRVLLYLLVERASEYEDRAKLGKGARSLLRHGLKFADDNSIVVLAIGLVADTYSTAPSESRQMLSSILEPSRLSSWASSEAPALARKIGEISKLDPEFASEIYRAVYSCEIVEIHETDLSRSRIMALRSNTSQDFEMARYSLVEHFSNFLSSEPVWASKAFVSAVDGCVLRDHPMTDDYPAHVFALNGKSFKLQEDHSYIWAHDPEASYGNDGETLVAKFLAHLREAPEAEALVLAGELMERGSLAIYWSRLFMAAAGRRDGLTRLLWPFSAQEVFLVSPDTRKDAIDLLVAGWSDRTEVERLELERSALEFDFSKFKYPEAAKDEFLKRLCKAIGVERLLTPEARAIAGKPSEPEGNFERNARLFSVHTSSEAVPRYHWLQDLDQTNPVNAALGEAIEVTEALFDFNTERYEDNPPKGPELFDSLLTFDTIIREVPLAHQGLRRHAEAVLSDCLSKLVERGNAPGPDDQQRTAHMLRLLANSAVIAGPIVDDETEKQFEESNGWGSPAGRLEAAQAIFGWLKQRPDLYTKLVSLADRLVVDPHPAVRLQAVLRLPILMKEDPDGFWSRVTRVALNENNLGVLDFVASNLLGNLLHYEPVKVEELSLAILNRFTDNSDRSARIREHIAPLLAILWASFGRPKAKIIIDHWLTQEAYSNASRQVLITLRGAVVLGLRDRSGSSETRHRAQDLFLDNVTIASQVLAIHLQGPGQNTENEARASAYADLLDVACRELYFAVVDHRNNRSYLTAKQLENFFNEVQPILAAIGEFGTPHTIYYLLQLLERLIAISPAKTFDVAALAITKGGRQHGFQFESMGADLMVRLIGLYLADHKEIFENEGRRNKLIECLEIFMRAGWTSARRLLFRLPDLFQ